MNKSFAPEMTTDYYLKTLVGRALVKTLDVKVKSKDLTPAQARFVLSKFYEAVPAVFNSSVASTMSFKAEVLNYNFLDGVWRFTVKNFGMSINNKVYRANFIQIIAKDAEINTDVSKKKKRKV